MKISTFIMMFLVIAAFMFVAGLISQEAKTYYPESNIDDSAWAGKYDYSSQINDSITPLQESFKVIGDSEKGWWSKLTSGIAAIPQAVIAFAGLTIGSFAFGSGIVTGTLTTLGVPSILIVIVIIMIIVWGIFKLIEVYQRWQV
jgi:hypothetical protein